MHTQNQPPNAGVRQVQFTGPTPPLRQPFVNQGMPYGQLQRGQNPTFFQQQLPTNVHYTQLPQLNHGGGSVISESRTSPPSVASTPGIPPPNTNHGNPLQPGPAIYYQQPPPPQRFMQPPPQQQQQVVYVIPTFQHQQPPQQQHQGGRPRPPFNNGQRPPPPIMQYQTLPPNFNMNQRFVNFNPQSVMPPMEGQYFDPSMQQQQHQQPQQQHFHNKNYRGKNGRGNGNSSQSSRRGSIRYDQRPDRPPSHPSPDSLLPQFAEQNVPLQQGQIMQQNPTYALSQFPPAMLPPQGQQYFIHQQFSQEAQMGQPVYLLQGDPANFHQQNQYYPAFQMVLPQQQMQQHQQHLPMDPHHPQHPSQQFISTPPSHTPIQEEDLFQAIKELQLEEKVKEQHHDSSERIEPAGVPALDAESVQSDADDYTPAGTPQSLNPLDGEQMDQILMGNDIVEKPLQSKEEKPFEKEDNNRKQEIQRKRQQKPEQQHYQPPRGGRTNAQRTNSWKSSTSQQSAQLTKIAEEKPKPTYPTAPMICEPSKPASVPSDTPTPRASPTPPPKPKEVNKLADVPMIGGVPLIGGKPLVAGVTEKVESSNEHCTYCELLGKSRHEITNHSLNSAKGIPACPLFRVDGCKLCGAKGDSAHLEEFCKKKANKENSDFKSMASQVFNMTPAEKGSIVLKDMGNHPTVQQIVSHPDEGFQNGIQIATQKTFIAQEKFRNDDQKEFEQNQIAEQHAHAMSQRHHYDDRSNRDDRFYRGGRSGPRGSGGDRGSGGGRSFSGQTYSGSRSRDGGYRGGNTGGGGGSRGSGGHRGGQYGGGERRGGGGGGNRYRN